jgi:tRNA pseudouridine32 synthase/23S rRNA pseudouridine746 synthase
MEVFHRFVNDIGDVGLPLRFNNPFYYSPHRLCVMASDAVRDILSGDPVISAEAAKGKMFGVLVVEDAEGSVGFLAAFSGLLAGTNRIDGFVPPVYDLLSSSGYFRQEEAEISRLNNEIREFECGGLSVARAAVAALEKAMEEELSSMREAMHACKERRCALRTSGFLSAADEAALVRESQFQKAELKRMTLKWKTVIAEKLKEQEPLCAKLAAMKEERKLRSAALQKWLFEQYVVYNARGECRNLFDIFAGCRGGLPPAGAGECAAPKLLQYAYLNGFRPLAMAEFWLGATPACEVRRDGCFYGSCKSKCEPILGFMLQGLDVEENALERGSDIQSLEIVYEDGYLVVVNKPAGVLSVPGIVGGMSVQQWLREVYFKNNDVHVVHRLDMATSGLLVAAKSMEIYKSMQRMFASREVQKRYTALLCGVPSCASGVVELPLAADYGNRPLQRVGYEGGKEAVTCYRVLGTQEYDGEECALVEFEPLTGRTHQLRVHSAHPCGLDAPIVGDTLYGNGGERLMLHASCLEFVHPVSGKVVSVKKEAPFFNEQ